MALFSSSPPSTYIGTCYDIYPVWAYVFLFRAYLKRFCYEVGAKLICLVTKVLMGDNLLTSFGLAICLGLLMPAFSASELQLLGDVSELLGPLLISSS